MKQLERPGIILASRPPTEKDNSYRHLTTWVYQDGGTRNIIAVYLRWQQSPKESYWRRFIEDKE